MNIDPREHISERLEIEADARDEFLESEEKAPEGWDIVETSVPDDGICPACGAEEIQIDGEFFCPDCDDPDWQDTEHDPFLSDTEADADVLASAGWGTDEDYGYYDDYPDYECDYYDEY